MTQTDIKLSALVVAQNEEELLGDCLKSLSFADELIVVLDRSTDRSAEIAREHDAQVLEGAWEIEGERRNTGISACGGRWILELDADERVTDALREEIISHIETAPVGHYLIPVRNFVGGREVRYGWGAYIGVNATVRLFTKGSKQWGAQRVHPSLEMTGHKGQLKNGLVHLVDRDLADMFDRVNRYTTLAARDAVAQQTVPSFWTSFRRIFSRGWKSYVARKGYKEGFYGIALGFLAGFYTMMIYLKCQELLLNRDDPPSA